MSGGTAAPKHLLQAGREFAGIRMDSGDLAYLSAEARRTLDEAGFPQAAVVVSNDLDEYLITDLKQYAYYGVGAIMSMGATDGWDLLAMRAETIPGAARFRSAGRGITRPEEGRTTVPIWVNTEAEARKAVDDNEVELEIAPSVKVRLARSGIAEVRAKGEPVKDPAKA